MEATRRLMGFLSIVLFGTTITPSANASGLFAPLTVDTAATLPKGVRSFRLSGFETEVDNRYDGYGAMVPLGSNFNKTVTVGQLVAARPAAEQGLLSSGLKAQGVSMTDTAGTSQGLVNANVSSLVPTVGYGITDRITVGAGIPIIHSATHVDAGWMVSGNFQNQLNSMMVNGLGAKILAVKPLLQNVVQSQLAAYGYEPLADENRTDIGDLNLGAKVKIAKTDLYSVALAPRVSIPTGRTADINKLVDLAPGDGHVNAGIAAVADINLSPRWVLSSSVSYTYQFASDTAVRVPLSYDSTLSPDIDHDVQLKQGDLMGAGLTAKYFLNDLMFAGLGYSIQYKNPDSYEGGQYTPDRYHYLEVDTFQEMQASQLSFTTSTVPLYRAGVFPIPMDATIAWAHVLDSKNVSMTDIGVIEIAAYF